MTVHVVKRWGSTALGVAIALLCLPAAASAALTWGAPFARDTAGRGPALTALSCASATCAALDLNGGEVTFAPGAPAPSVATAALPSTPIAATCPSASLCIAIDVSGNEITFNPAAPVSAKATAIDPGQITVSLSCPSTPVRNWCVAVDTAGNEVSFDPGSPSGAKVHSLGSNGLAAVSCPGFSTTSPNDAVCMALDSTGKALTFDGTTGQTTASQTIESGSTPPKLTEISCPSLTKCVAFDNAGGEFILNPTLGGGLTTTTLDGGHSIIASSCLSTTQCVVLDDAGQELTFAPGGTKLPAAVINPAKTSLALACASPTLCFAAETTGHVIGFNPQNGSVLGTSLVDGASSYAALACAAPSQCTATDHTGDAVTFDPATGATSAAATVDTSNVAMFAVACPSATQCTAVDEKGQEVTFNPQAPASSTPTAVVKNHPLLAVSCPSVTQCTAVDDDQYAVTFNPGSPTSGIYALLGTPAGVSLTGIACPSLTQCTAVDGIGEEVTFDPQSPGHPKPFALLSDGAIDVACPTTGECVAVGSGGERSTFSPAAPQSATSATIDLAQPTALSCPVATRCMATDTANHVVEFDPGGSGVAAVSAPATSAALTAVACTSAGACVTTDSTGVAFAGRASVPPPPGAAGAPRIGGRFLQGQKLTVSTGGWTNAPTSYYPRWERCSLSGGACAVIAGATGRSYTLTAPDAGHTLKVSEIAANAGGFGATQLSPRTPMIVGLPTAPALVTPALSGTRGTHPRLSLDLRSSRWGPAVRSVSITLPSGVSLAWPRHHSGAFRALAGLAITVGGRAGGRSIRRASRGLTIALTRPATDLRIALSRPLLIIAAPLAKAVATHRIGTLAIRLRVVGANGRAYTVYGVLRVS